MTWRNALIQTRPEHELAERAVAHLHKILTVAKTERLRCSTAVTVEEHFVRSQLTGTAYQIVREPSHSLSRLLQLA